MGCMSTLFGHFQYAPRVVDDQIRRCLGFMPTVLIEGPRGCGKTTTARGFADSELLLDSDSAAREHAEHGTLPLHDGPFPMLIDEWQLAPAVWNRVRRASDDMQTPGRFILTGSADPADDTTRHSGAGRVVRVRMRPMSLHETGDSTGAVSLSALLAGGVCSASRTSPITRPEAELRQLVDVICRGGWPVCRNMGAADAQDFITAYLEEVCRVDVPRVNGVRHDPVGVRRIVQALARHTASSPTMRTLAADVGVGSPVSHETLRSYLDALTRIFVVEDQNPWTPRLTSRARLRKACKRHLADPALAVSALNATPPQHLFDDRETLGHLFESLVVRDLRVYAQACRATVLHYRDSNNLEADAVVQSRDGAWMAVEVKLGAPESVDTAAASLLKLHRLVDTRHSGRPAKLLVITATGYAYERSDGVAVTPITLLGP